MEEQRKKLAKFAMRILAIFLIIGGIFTFVVSNKIIEEAQGSVVYINGQFSGNMGADPEDEEMGKSLKGIGILTIALGGGLLVFSFVKPKNNGPDY